MTKDTFPCSDKAKAMLSRDTRPMKYPWTTMEVGTSFQASKAEVSHSTMVNNCYKMGRKYGKKFRVVEHDGDIMEIVRLNDPKPIDPLHHLRQAQLQTQPVKPEVKIVSTILPPDNVGKTEERKAPPAFWGDDKK